MADNETEEEPSIEEILDSIRQIISDDEEEGEAVAEEEPAAEEPAAEPEPEPEPEPAPEPEPEPEISADDVEEVQVDMRDTEPEEEVAAFADIPVDENEIITGATESMTMQGFDKLVKQTKVEYAGITLEQIVRTELKPLLKEWLDDNLPSIIERLVEEELRRVSKAVLGNE